MIRRSGMQIGEEERFVRRFLAPPFRLQSHKDGINLFQYFRIIRLENPTAIGFVIHVEDSQANWSRLARAWAPPSLNGLCFTIARLLIQIEGIKNQGFSPRIENTPEGLLGLTLRIDVENIRNVKLAGTHQFANITIGGEILLLPLRCGVELTKLSRKLIDLRFKAGTAQESLFTLDLRSAEILANRLK